PPPGSTHLLDVAPAAAKTPAKPDARPVMELGILCYGHVALDAGPEPAQSQISGALDRLLEPLSASRNSGVRADAVKEVRRTHRRGGLALRGARRSHYGR